MLSRIISVPSPLHAAASSRPLGAPPLPPNDIRLYHIRSACTRRFPSIAYHGPPAPFNQRKKPLGAVGTRSSADREEDNDSDDENVTNSLRATIKQSQKILEIQRNLLQQITEKRNLESSTGKYTKEEEPASYDQNDSSSSDLGIGKDEEHDRKNSSWNSSDSFTQLSTEHGTDDDESINDFEVADALGLSREDDFEQSQLPAVPTQSQTFPTLLESQPLPVLHEQPESNVLRDKHHRVPTEAYAQASNKQQEPPPKEAGPSPLAGVDVMNVIIVAAECAPWSKTGGLGDVIGALPKALARRGHRVMVVVPRYGHGDYAEAKEIGELRRCKVYGQDLDVTYYQAYIDNVDFVFIDSPIFRNIRNDIYGGNRLDILKRMVFFCKVAVEVPWHVPCGGVCYGDGNLVFVANDWHTSLLSVYLKAYYRDKGFMKYARCVLVVHNIAHQGRGPLQDYSHVDLADNYKDLFKVHDPVGGVHFNIFAAGLKTADRVITVSSGYAWELKTPEGGRGLHKLINDIDWKFHGIVNGIDTAVWNPKFDTHLQSDGYTTYSPESIRTGKPQCKAALQRELGLPVRPDVPIIAFIGRLDYQKGVDIIADAMQWFVGQDIQLIMLGSGRSDLEEMLRKFERYHREKVRGWVGFSVKMAHRITAGADVLLMPSRYEPCGLNQLHGFMYGTVPVVHAVGGLKDTVKQFDPYNETGLGWTFERAEASLMVEALGHALNTYRNFKGSWEGLQRRGMAQDLSWNNAAQQYEEVLLAAKYHW